MLMLLDPTSGEASNVIASSISMNVLFGLFEVPLLLFVSVITFLTANSLKGGRFGKGMNQIAWGLSIMAGWQILLQLDHYMGADWVTSVLSHGWGRILWVLAAFFTWGLAGLGFYRIFRASKY